MEKDKKEHKHEHHVSEAKVTPKKEFRLPNIWMIATAALLLVVIFMMVSKPAAQTATGLTPAECGQKTIKYLNDNLVQVGTTASLASVNEESGVYAVITDYLNRSITVYTTKDCSLLFLSSLNTTQEIPLTTTTVETTPITKTSKPMVELYVMAFCPYGVQAEQSMEPVANLLGSKADIKVMFIANVGGDNVSSVQSLHGINEAKEDLRQLCIMKYYPEKYWSYLMDIDTNCYPLSRDDAGLDLCWKNASTKLGFNISKIETCAYGSEGITLLKADEVKTEQNSVSGSPTLIINGARYNGARTPDAFKAAICSAFTTAPAECSQNLSATGGTTSGNCG
jgi:hypothetical protein